jgi:glucosamine--fructose-6-phosphate aminotransferase (isomerizing)
MTTEIATTYRMREQIHETGDTVRRALDPSYRPVIQATAGRLAAHDRIYATGSGTSMHAALFARHAFWELARIEVIPVSTSDLLATPPLRAPGVPMLAFSQSGVSKATVDAASRVVADGDEVISVVSVDLTPLTAVAGQKLVIPGGRDTALAKTKSFTTAMVVVVLLALELARLRGTLEDTDRDRWAGLLEALPTHVDATLALEPDVAHFAARAPLGAYWFFVGSGPNAITAPEIALKMKETNYAAAEGYEVEEAGHGRLQPIDGSSIVVLITTARDADARLRDIAAAVREIGARIAVIGFDAADLAQPQDEWIRVPDVGHALLTPIVNVIPGQLLAYELAVRQGFDPDLIRTDDPRYGRMNRTVFPPGTH